MSRYDSMVSAEAWDTLTEEYAAAGGEAADDHTLAELLRQRMIEVEG